MENVTFQMGDFLGVLRLQGLSPPQPFPSIQLFVRVIGDGICSNNRFAVLT